jgi:hypothetical protein
MLRLKSFIYRFFNIVGLNIYLADKEEQKYIDSLDKPSSDLALELARGLWQADNGFTTVWTYTMPWHKSLVAKVKHAFRR